MIDESLKQSIIATLGKHYSGNVIERLNEKEIFDSKGKSYSPGSIRNIVCGLLENKTVEAAIIDFVNDEIEKQRKVSRKVSNLKKKQL